jgi:pyruvate decarboxylase
VTCVLKSKPVYIFLPLDMVDEPVDAGRLDTPLDLSPPRDADVEEEVVAKTLEAIYNAKNPMILADVLTARFHCTPEVRQLVDITQFPVLSNLARINLVFHHELGKRHPE